MGKGKVKDNGYGCEYWDVGVYYSSRHSNMAPPYSLHTANRRSGI